MRIIIRVFQVNRIYFYESIFTNQSHLFDYSLIIYILCEFIHVRALRRSCTRQVQLGVANRSLEVRLAGVLPQPQGIRCAPHHLGRGGAARTHPGGARHDGKIHWYVRVN